MNVVTTVGPEQDYPAPTGDADRSDLGRMLLLALVSYKGFHDLRPGRRNLGRLRSSVEYRLATVAPLAGEWELVWGPATYRAPFTLFDDNVMYVARHRRRRHVYAVALRGTNPISAADWLMGDFWVGGQVVWPYGDPSRAPQARISFSSSLGLSVLQSMHAPGPRGGRLGALYRLVDDDLGDTVRMGIRSVAGPPTRALLRRLRRLRARLRADLARLDRWEDTVPGEEVRSWAYRVTARWASWAARRLFATLEELTDLAGQSAQRQVLELIQASAGLRSRWKGGEDLVTFLRQAVAAADGEIEVIVTGHSKGGSLASVLAMWLADTQGTSWVTPLHGWDPDRRARVRCYSFAGPTPGNSAFARLVEETFGSDHHRVSNRLDMVCHAWAVRPLAGSGPDGLYLDDVPRLYPAPVRRLRGLAELAEVVVRDVRPLDYRHIGGSVTLLEGRIDPHRTLFLEQAVYQHLEAYVDALGLGEVVDSLALFLSPLR